jgi:hypothetical protein
MKKYENMTTKQVIREIEMAYHWMCRAERAVRDQLRIIEQAEPKLREMGGCGHYSATYQASSTHFNYSEWIVKAEAELESLIADFTKRQQKFYSLIDTRETC